MNDLGVCIINKFVWIINNFNKLSINNINKSPELYICYYDYITTRKKVKEEFVQEGIE